MISTQAAISFENAVLYKNIQNANKLLEAKNKSLLELDQVKDQFLANTSHELRYFATMRWQVAKIMQDTFEWYYRACGVSH